MVKYSSPQPLLETKITCLGHALAIPYAAMKLADMGASITKIEDIHGGDESRRWEPPSIGGESAYFLGVNRNKRSIAIDLRSKRGQEIVCDLTLQSDVFLENYSRGALKHYGIDLVALRKKQPRLITASGKGFAKGTPKEDDPGYDLAIQARSGIMSVTGIHEPTRVGFALIDLMLGQELLTGITAALYAREREGVGTHVEADLYSVAVSMLPSIAQGYLISGVVPGLQGNQHANIVPYQTFLAKDNKPFVVSIGTEKHWATFCTVVGHGEWAHDLRFASNAQRVLNRAELVPLLEQLFLTKTRGEWVRLLEKNRLIASPIQTIEEVFRDPNVLKAGMLTHVQHPTAGDVRLINSPLRFADTIAGNHQPPPLLGEHTDDILLELGLSEKEIAELRAHRIVA